MFKFAFCSLLIARNVLSASSFALFPHRLSPNKFHRSLLSESKSDEDQQPSRPSNLVDKNTFLAAVDALKAEIAKETGKEFPQAAKELDGHKIVYILGRVELKLSFAPTPPGLALTDATGLTLVAGVGESSMDSGIEPFDTITAIGADGGSFRKETNGFTLSETTATLTEAANYAVGKGQTEIEVEVNRLMQGYYSS